MIVPPDLLARYAPVAPVDGCAPLVAHQAPDVFALWQAWEAATGRRQPVPFWAAVWPAAQVLARWLLDHPARVEHARVLDLGCGGGVVAIAAAAAGAAHVVANDVDPAALAVALQNAAANRVHIEGDNTDLLDHPSSVRADLVLVADLFYERQQAGRIAVFLQAVRRSGTRAIVADAGRTFAPRTGIAIVAHQRVAVNRELEGVSEREVAILEIA